MTPDPAPTAPAPLREPRPATMLTTAGPTRSTTVTTAREYESSSSRSSSSFARSTSIGAAASGDSSMPALRSRASISGHTPQYFDDARGRAEDSAGEGGARASGGAPLTPV